MTHFGAPIGSGSLSGFSAAGSPSMDAGDLVTNAWLSWKQDASDLARNAEYFLSNLSTVDIVPISTEGMTYSVPDPSFASSADFGDIPSAKDISQQVFTIPAPPDVIIAQANIGSIPYEDTLAPGLVIRDPGQFSKEAPTLGFELGTLDRPDSPDISVVTPESFSGSAPSASAPSVGSAPRAPSTSFQTPGSFSGQRPNVDVSINYPGVVAPPTLAYPTAPEDTTGKAPGTPSFVVPDAPQLDIPTWDSVAPVNNLTAPTPSVTFEPDDYTSTSLDEIQSAISDMLSGSGGIPQQIWDSMFNKARADEEKAGAVEIAAAFDEWAARGFDLQSGILDRNIREIRTNVGLKSTALIQGMRSEQAKSELDNLRHAVQHGVSLEAQLMDLFDKSQNRLLAIQELEIKVATEIFGMKVTVFNTQLEAYKAEATVFKDRVQAALAHIEIYKAEIDAEKLKLEAGKISVDIYEATVKAYGEKVNAYKVAMDALRVQVEVYSAQVEARKTNMEVERLKLGVAETKIKLYATDVEAYKALAQAVSINNDSNKTKADVYRAEIEGYRAEVEAAKLQLTASELNIRGFQADIDAHKSNTQAIAIGNEANKHNVDVYQADILALRADVEAEKLKIDDAQLSLSGYSSGIEAFKANTAAAGVMNDANSSRAQIYKAAIDGYATRIQGYRAQNESLVEITKQKNEANEYITRRYSAQLDAIKTQIQQETTRMQQLVAFFDAKSRVHKANADITQGEASYNIAAWQAQASVASDKARVAAEKAKVDLEQILRIAELESSNAKTAAQVYGQVGAATLAGVTMSAGITERSDWSNSYSENHNHNYEE